MAKKVILKDNDNIEILPITRGELITDSSGNPAFHSIQFLATDSQPGLMSAEDKAKLDDLEKVIVEDKKVEQVNTTTNDSYRLLFSSTADDTTRTEGARKSANLLFNPSTGALTAPIFNGKLDWSNINNKPDTFTPEQHTHTTNEIVGLLGYTKAESPEDLITTDTLNVALGKLEYKADTLYTWYRSITDEDTDDIVNKWGEIVDFIDSVAEGTDIIDEFVTRKTAQTIIGSKIFSAETSITNTLTSYNINPATTNTYSLGTTELLWQNIYAANGNFSNVVNASGFVKKDSSDDYILLGGGGHKALSDISNDIAYSLDKSLTVTQDWMDTGISGSDIPSNGTYVIQVYCHQGVSGGFWECYWSGIMSWYSTDTNNTHSDEIILHASGHSYTNTIYLRTIMQTQNVLKLQIAANTTLASATYTFKFKKLL